MTQTVDLSKQAFMTALLFTGSEERAEDAVLQAIESCPAGDGHEADLIWETLAASVRGGDRFRRPSRKEQETNGRSLPVELRKLMRLAPQLRQCFVLRVLANRSREECAQLLDLRPREVDAYVCTALKHLAAPARAEQQVAMAVGTG